MVAEVKIVGLLVHLLECDQGFSLPGKFELGVVLDAKRAQLPTWAGAPAGLGAIGGG